MNPAENIENPVEHVSNDVDDADVFIFGANTSIKQISSAFLAKMWRNPTPCEV